MGATDLSVLPQRQVAFPETVFRSAAAADVPLRVEGIVGQTGNLQEWRNGSGGIVSSLSPTGDSILRRAMFSGGEGIVDNAAVRIQAGVVGGVGNKGLVIRGVAGQTGSLAEFQMSDGSLRTRIAGDSGALGININPTGVGWLAVSGVNATDTLLAVRGVASHTGNLTQWQNSAGAVLSSVTSNGTFRAPLFINTGFDFILGDGDQTSRGNSGPSRAFVKWSNSSLFVNFDNDFSGGIILGGPISNSQKSTTAVSMILTAVASQSADLLQFRNSAGGVLSAINSSGHGYFNALHDAGQRVAHRGRRSAANDVDPNVAYLDGGSLNAFYASGLYNCVNMPTNPWGDNRWFWVQVFTHISGAHWQKQIAHDMTGGGSSYERKCNGGDPTVATSWTAWSYIRG